MESHEKTLKRTYEDLQIAKRSGDRDAIKEAQEKYERAVKNVTLNNDKYKAMLNETTAKLAHVNEVALSYINNKTPKIYTLNYNEFANQDIDGYTFTLVNENAVRNLIKSDKIELPPKKLDVPKDKRWNAKNINSQLMQGLLQGESIPKIAKRLQNVTDMNERSAVRSARTMVTGAQNKGRQDSFTKATDDGVIMERKWVAAYEPGRTRDWHLELNGVVVGVDEPFENSVGKIMYPGDPSADPSNVYNCRCAIRAIVKGFKWNQKEEPDDVDSKELTFEEKLNNIQTVNFNLKPSDNSDMIKVPIDLDEKPAAFDTVGLDNKDYLHFLKQVSELPFEEREIPLSDVIATQSIVNKQGVLKSLGSTEPIDVVLVDGKYYIYNGHHRAAAAMINGDDKILAKVRIVDKQSATTSTVVQGKDISDTWVRRPDKFDFAIEDVVNAQGFDGLPKVVSSEEFDRYVQESNIIAVRGYIAPDQETLNVYQDQLYHGKWYIDCSKGGDAYGKGMYAAYNKGVKPNEATIGTGQSYGGGDNGKIETMTLDSSAKFISHKDAVKLREEYCKKEDELIESLLKDKIDKANVNGIEKDYMLDRYFSIYNYDVDTVGWYKGLSEIERDKIDEKISSIAREIKEEVENAKYDIRKVDEGTVAAMYGYDAMYTGEGEEGYLIILNRTKVIFKGE